MINYIKIENIRVRIKLWARILVRLLLMPIRNIMERFKIISRIVGENCSCLSLMVKMVGKEYGRLKGNFRRDSWFDVRLIIKSINMLEM